MEQINHSKIETKWQNKWEEYKTFVPKITKQTKYFGNVAYPYANSVMHIGHGRTYTIADIYMRYQRVLGKNVLQPLGYHISGTPVLAVADGIKRKDPKTLKQVREAISDYTTDKKEQDDLIETFKEPQNIANYFSKTIEGSLNSIGIAIDWTRQFTTGDGIYNKFIEWQYSKLKEKGLLVQGKYPILYSAQDQNAVGEDDIKDGDIDKVAVSNMIAIKFKLLDSNDYVLCATLRADALFCATNLWIKPSMELVKLKVNNENWIVSKDAQVKFEHQFDNVEFVEKLKGDDLIGKEVIVPILNKQVPIYRAEFCDSKHGTGLVYSSPADSPVDYLNLFEIKFPNKSLKDFQDTEPLNLTPITQTFDKKGTEIKYKANIPAYDILLKRNLYSLDGNEDKMEDVKQELYKQAHFGAKMINCGEEFDGTPLKNNIAADKVYEKLKELNLAVPFYETSRRAQTRGNDDVIIANLQGQWFLNYSDRAVKDKALELLDKSRFFPQNLKQTEVGYIEWANMRPCARKRGLGTQIPYDRDWIIEPLSDSTIYQMLYIINNSIKEHNIKPEELTFEVFDYLYFGKGNSSEFNISSDFLKEAREQVKYWNNVDFRYVGMPHMSNHLNFLIYHYSLIFPESMWPSTIVAGNLMMRDGEKISKSKGNGTPLYRMKNMYGADLYRLYIGTNSNYDVEMDFKEEEIQNLKKKFSRWTDLMSKALEEKTQDYTSYSETDKWLISKFYSSVKTYFEHFENFKIREAYVELFYETVNSLNYHIQRTSEQETAKALRFFAEDFLNLMTPITPHICEELYDKIKTNKEEFISLKEFTTNYEQYIDKKTLATEEIISELIKKIRAQLERVETRPKSIQVIQAKTDKFELYDLIKDVLEKQGNNPKLIFEEINKNFSQYSKFAKKFVPKCLGSGISFYLNKEDEKLLLENNKEFLEKEFNTKIEILDADNIEDQINANPKEFGVKIN